MVADTINDCINKLLIEATKYHDKYFYSINEFTNLIESINQLYIIKTYLSNEDISWEDAFAKSDNLEAEISCEDTNIRVGNQRIRVLKQYEILSLIKYNYKGEKIVLWEQ